MDKKISISYIGLGSNLNSPEYQIRKAINAIDSMHEINIISYSRLYQTRPLGPQNQPDYVNAVAKIATCLTPYDLLCKLKNIELIHGRKANEVWGARIIDLDILLYDNIILKTDVLVIPHAQLKFRDFVLFPLLELTPDLILPTGESVRNLVKQKNNTHVKNILKNAQENIK